MHLLITWTGQIDYSDCLIVSCIRKWWCLLLQSSQAYDVTSGDEVRPADSNYRLFVLELGFL